MIAKTVTGSDFEGALTYGAGLRKGKTKEPGDVEPLYISNVVAATPQLMARQMQSVAAESRRVQKPVWHTVLSWKAGEVVTKEQKVAAVKRYCELMGAPAARHQVVVYEHKDKKHAHVHIYLNRVPVDGGPALRTSNNFYRQPAVTRQISEELGMQPLPVRRQSVKDVDPGKEAARAAIREAVQQLLQEQGRGGEQWLQEQLRRQQIQLRYTHDKGGVLRGVSFEWNGVAVKGQEVGYKGAQLREALQASVTHAQAPQLPATGRDQKRPGRSKKGPGR
ncbi:relaxase/mobilization nuclease domain-containing protein [Hymenobacter sp. B81]|uniref:relaxase/mobilization nuclease domain-containing protein n=1 Tax=Hymenobacter sp. B81 TaxID=3344878 RepID=UPI0037DDB1B9